jgi:hypothetical protein
MKTFFFAALLFSFGTLFAKHNETELFQHLINVNAEWSKHPETKNLINHVEINNLQNFNEWIATHLMLVELTLRSKNVSHLSEVQIMNRFTLLDKLNKYWKAGVFPVNDYLAYKNPVFIDRIGTHCAVGYLMQQSGAEKLARQIDAEQKFAYVHEIKVAGVKAWADENGFTINELAWIQPGYPPTIDAEDMDKGFDGTVNTIVVDEAAQIVYAAGAFTNATTGIVCNNIAAWISGIAGYDWISLGNGVNGTIHTMLLHNNKLYVGGEFTMADNIAANHVAVYDITLGQWQAMGSLDSTVRALAIYNNEVYAGGDFTGFVSKWDGNAWQIINNSLIGSGSVRTLEVWNNELVIGGNFELITGAPRYHVATFDGTYMGTLGFGTLTPVNDFEIHQGKLFAACDFVSGTDTCALAVFDTMNGNWTVELSTSISAIVFSYLAGNSFRHITSAGSELLIAGDFFSEAGMVMGNNLASYDRFSYPGDTTVYQRVSALLTADKPVNSIAVSGLNVYFGGEFITNAYTDTLNHIGNLQLTPVGISNKAEKKMALKVFPNPVTDVVNIQSGSDEKINDYRIYDISGKLLQHKNVNAAFDNISLKHLPEGIYTLVVSSAGGSQSAQIVKQ